MSKIYPEFVPNIGPYNAPIWIIGESPGEEEVKQLEPFVGQSGQMLMQVLANNGVNRSDVRLCNLSNYRPYANDFAILRGTTFLEDCMTSLRNEIIAYKPRLIIALGNEASNFTACVANIHRNRGNILHCQIPECYDIKVIPTFHPSFVLRTPSAYPTFCIDIEKAVRESRSSIFPSTERTFTINPDGIHLRDWEEKLIESPNSLASDIESVRSSTNILCVGYALDPYNVVCLSTDKPENLKVIANVNASKVGKTYHFGIYDRLVQELAGFPVSNTDFDTFIAQHVLAPELPATLEYLASIYTNEPAYKQEGRGEIPTDVKVWSTKANAQNLYIYNCKDCAYTSEIALQQRQELAEQELEHIFTGSMEQMELAISMSLRGMKVDKERVELFKKALTREWYIKQNALNAAVQMIYNKNLGNVNVRSGPTLKKLLYNVLDLPERKKSVFKNGNRISVVTADEDAIVSLITFCENKIASLRRADKQKEWEYKARILRAIIDIRGIRQLLSLYIDAEISEDGRIRSTYKVGGTETGRWSASAFVDGTGINSQTFSRDSITIPDDIDDAVDFSALIAANKEDE